jgi:hypothetical protein
MSKVTYVIPASQLSALRKKAKALKKSSNIPLHEAQVIVARKYGFTCWEQLKKSTDITEHSEKAYRTGLMWAMDMKDAEPSSMEGIVQDHQIQMLLLSDFVKVRGGINKEDEYFLEDLLDMNIFYRYQGETPQTIEQARQLISEYFFFEPNFVWFKGDCYSFGEKFDYDKFLEESKSDDFF